MLFISKAFSVSTPPPSGWAGSTPGPSGFISTRLASPLRGRLWILPAHSGLNSSRPAPTPASGLYSSIDLGRLPTRPTAPLLALSNQAGWEQLPVGRSPQRQRCPCRLAPSLPSSVAPRCCIGRLQVGASSSNDTHASPSMQHSMGRSMLRLAYFYLYR
jgi:hypothetical protein